MAISKRNRRGVWVLIVLCVGLACIPRVLAGWSQVEMDISYEAINQAEKEVVAKQQKRQAKKKKYVKKKKNYQAPKEKFDPNSYEKKDWMQLGLSGKQADVVLKFTSRGIYSNEELKKIFVIPDEVFELVKDSTFYPDRNTAYKSVDKNIEKNIKIFNINTATAEELKSLPGIGDFYADKIIEQRQNLGGYVGKYQLLDIWKFGVERYEKIEGRIEVLGEPIKININTADIDALKSHPYISYKIANSIVKMRNAHGAFSELEELMKSVLIDRELFFKIKPYLTL